MPEVGRAANHDRREIAEVVSHELAHMVRQPRHAEWWDDLWLNEAFADWLGTAADEQYPELRGEVRKVRQLTTCSATTASGRPIRTPVDPKNVFETTNLFAAYRKGALLGATLALLGEDTLRRGPGT